MEVQFVASIAPIVRDLEAARAFYQGALGLSLEGGGGGDYKYTHRLEGTKHMTTSSRSTGTTSRCATSLKKSLLSSRRAASVPAAPIHTCLETRGAPGLDEAVPKQQRTAAAHAAFAQLELAKAAIVLAAEDLSPFVGQRRRHHQPELINQVRL